MNPYESYYSEQAGSGLAAFEGIRYQRGNGFFGRMWHSALLPLARFIGKHALKTGIGYAGDVIENKSNWRQAAKDRLKEGAKEIAFEGLNRARKFQQTGTGKRKTKRKPIKTKRKPIKTKRKSIKGRRKSTLFD